MELKSSPGSSSADPYMGQDYGRMEEFLNLFSKGIKTSVLYPSENPIPREFKMSCWQKLRSYLKDYSQLELDISPDAFKRGQRTIFKAPTREENIAGLMHRDGIRRLSFKRELQKEEWEGFFDCVMTVFRDRDNFEDLVNLFWQKDFLNIEYDAVDDFSLAEYNDLYTHKEASEVEYANVILAESQAETSNLLDVLNPEKADSKQDFLRQTAKFNSLFRNIQRFSIEERRYIEALLVKDEELIIEFEAIELIFDILISERQLPNFDESISTIQDMFDKMLDAEQFPLLVYTVKRMKEVLETVRQKSSMQADKLKDCLARSGDRIRIARISNLLNKGSCSNYDGIRMYLEELDWDSLPSLIWMLGELNNFPARKMLIQALVNKGRERIDVIGNAVYDSRWYVIRNAILILGEIGDPKAISYLKKPAEHFDERVRWETLAALEKIGDHKGYEHLIPLLYDESDRIRHKVIELFSFSGFSQAFNAFKTIIFSNDFSHLEPEEQKDIILALARTGGEQAIPVLKRIIKRRAFFGSEKTEKQKEAAILALSQIDSEEALGIIRKLAQRKKGIVAAYARLVMGKKAQKQGREREEI